MSSAGNQNPWSPYNTYKDCSQGICSVYCPQWCYIFFSPPPPFASEDDSATDFSPLIIAVIGILASAFILVSYYTIISKYCRRRRGHGESSIELNENREQTPNEAWQNATGLDEALIKSITVFKYKKGDGFIESTDCSVCLSEFQENESLRLLPKCSHAFHLPCIDTWLKSHASCPLCRANVSSTNIFPGQEAAPVPETPRNTNVSTQEYQHRIGDAVLMIQEPEGSVRQEAVFSLAVRQNIPKICPIRHPESMYDIGTSQVPIPPVQRSVSCNFPLRQSQVTVVDILSISEDDVRDERRTEVGS